MAVETKCQCSKAEIECESAAEGDLMPAGLMVLTLRGQAVQHLIALRNLLLGSTHVGFRQWGIHH